jgi:hypothetical protein
MSDHRSRELDSSGESRARMIAQATRQALVADIRRARATIPAGLALLAVGGGLVGGVAYARPGLVGALLVGGVGLFTIPFGLAVIVRAAGTMVTARRKIRELDGFLPTARVLP